VRCTDAQLTVRVQLSRGLVKKVDAIVSDAKRAESVCQTRQAAAVASLKKSAANTVSPRTCAAPPPACCSRWLAQMKEFMTKTYAAVLPPKKRRIPETAPPAPIGKKAEGKGKANAQSRGKAKARSKGKGKGRGKGVAGRNETLEDDQFVFEPDV
jgi:hypothetical protein